MNKRIRVVFALGLLVSKVFAGEVDVYGTSSEVSEKIIQKYGILLAGLEEKRIRNVLKQENTHDLEQQINKCVQDIKRDFSIPSLKVDTVFYPDINKIYSTIDCCAFDKDDKSFFENYPKPYKMDVVDRMHFFIEKAQDLMVSHPEYANALKCRDFQCITPELPEFKTDLDYFRKTVPKHKQFIEKTIFNDANLERRRSAIFLLAYYQNPQEINHILISLLSDKSYFIRHDALRVYGELYAKASNLKVPIHKILSFIHACDVAERNKALILVKELARHTKYHPSIKHETKQLIQLLSLKQPNNHLLAYDILKIISHKSYEANDLKHWMLWEKTQNTNM